MQSKLFIALPILIVPSRCGEETTAQDHPPEPSGEKAASETSEMTSAEGYTHAPDFDLQEPVTLD